MSRPTVTPLFTLVPEDHDDFKQEIQSSYIYTDSTGVGMETT